MSKVHLFSSFADPAEDTHWASPYAALRRAFREYPPAAHTLVDDPDEADLIVICPRPRNPVFPVETFRGSIAWRHRRKCVVLSTDDNPTMTHKGFYTALAAGRAHSPWIHGGFYPAVAYGVPSGRLPADAMDLLFSFTGRLDTHPVRGRIGELAAGGWPRDTTRAFRVRHAGPVPDQEVASYKGAYEDDLRRSAFILCPRGMCPSSLRLFEAMKAGRVPVVISDEWVPPPHVPWERFVVRIREGDVASIPAILEAEAASFGERAEAASNAWDTFFAAPALAATVADWGCRLVRQAGSGHGAMRHLATLGSQLLRWRFVRRGLVSELARLGAPRAGAGR